MGRVKNQALDAKYDRLIGHKGGTSATAGHKAEKIAGRGAAKTVFFGQRVLVVTEPMPGCCALVRAARSFEEARSWVIRGEEDKHSIFWCETVDGQPFTPPST